MARHLQFAAGLGAAVLLVGAACSDDRQRDRAVADIAGRSAAEQAGAAPADTSPTVPGVGSGTAVANAAGSDVAQASASGAGTGGGAGGAGTPGTAAAGRTGTATPPPTTVALRATLTGEAGVPDPGIAGGTGVATLKITGTRMCYTLKSPIAEKPIVAHIHKGAAGQTGDIVINFEAVFQRAASAFVAEKCLNKDPALLAGIIADPAGFYVNVHTGEHPRGALRGQLQQSG